MCLPTPLNGCASLLQNVEIIFTIERMNTPIVSIISLSFPGNFEMKL